MIIDKEKLCTLNNFCTRKVASTNFSNLILVLANPKITLPFPS